VPHASAIMTQFCSFSCAFFHCSNIPFDFRYMFIVGGNIERYAHVGYDAFKALNFNFLENSWSLYSLGLS